MERMLHCRQFSIMLNYERKEMGLPNERPSYDLSNAKELVAEDMFSVGSRAARFVRNHYGGCTGDVVKEVFASIGPGGFQKTVELEKRPGTMADVYHARYDDATWYVKFFIDDEARLRVRIWSCNWDGCIH